MAINVKTGFDDGEIFTASGGVPVPISRADLAADAAFQVYAVPAGGTTGQVLAKDSNTDRDLVWNDPGGVGGTVDVGDVTGLDAHLDTIVENFPIVCVWTGAAWTTLGGDAVPTTATLVRYYDSSDDEAATAPTAYNLHDKWFGVDA
jgi:hypothetical protein